MIANNNDNDLHTRMGHGHDVHSFWRSTYEVRILDTKRSTTCTCIGRGEFVRGGSSMDGIVNITYYILYVDTMYMPDHIYCSHWSDTPTHT